MEALLALLALTVFLGGPVGFILALIAVRRVNEIQKLLNDAHLNLISLEKSLSTLRERIRSLEAAAPSPAPPEERAAAAPSRSATPAAIEKPVIVPVGLAPPSPPSKPAPPIRAVPATVFASASPPNPAPSQVATADPAKPMPAPPSASAPVTSAPATPIAQTPPAVAGRPNTSPSHAAAPAISSTKPASAPPARTRRAENWEAVIGGSWLNRIGVALVVIAVAFALGYSLTVLGPGGKAALATAVSIALLLCGVALERRERYAFYGRGLIGGGWAALYATAYAVHELPATRIVESPFAGFALLIAVGAGMIGHSLRYNNQGLTALAYALGYAAIVLHSIQPYTLAAAAILGFGTVLHLLKRRWYGAAFGGVLATYGSLLLWYLRQEAMTVQTLEIGLGALVMNWLVFLVSDFASEPRDEISRRNAVAISVLNAFSAGTLSFMAWSRFAPGSGWQPLAAFGAAFAITSTVLRRLGRATVHPVHSVAACVLVALAAGVGLPTSQASWVWLAEAQIVFLIGYRLRDAFHRWLGCLLFLAPMISTVVTQTDRRMHAADGSLNIRQLLMSAAACLCFYFTLGRLRSIKGGGAGGGASSEIDEGFTKLLSYGAFTLILFAIWVQLPAVWVAPAAAVLMLLLFEVSAIRKLIDLRIQSYVAAFAAVASSLALTAGSNATAGGVQARVPALIVVAAALFTFFFRRSSGRARLAHDEETIRPFFPWAGTTLLALLAWLTARPAVVGPAWMVLALLLIESGVAFRERHLKLPGYVAIAASHVSLLVSNLTATELVFGWSVRSLTVVPCIAATYYVWWRLRALLTDRAARTSAPFDETFGRILSYAAGALVGLFVRFEFGLEHAALRWSLAMVALLIAGYLLRDADFRLQAYALGAAVIVRAVGFDFQHARPFLGLDGPLAVATGGVFAYAAAGYLVRRRLAERGAGPRPSDRRTMVLEAQLEASGQDILWILAVALAALYAWRTWTGFGLIVVWALQGLVATAAGFAAKSPPLRYAGLGLFGLGLAMTLYRTFTEFDTIGRIVSFLVLGVVLLVVSFAYTRYRDALKRAQ